MNDSEEPATRWVYRQHKGVTLAWREPIHPVSDWVFNEHNHEATNPRQDLRIRNISRGRDDFSYGGFSLSTGETIFHFEMGRAYHRELTDEERAAYPRYIRACVYLIVDRDLSEDQRQSVLEWLQAKEDGITFQRLPDAPRSLMRLESVSGIGGY